MKKTIPQIAEEIGVSRQAVNQKIKQEPLSTSLRKFTSTIGKVVYIDDDGQELIKSAFPKNQTSTCKVNSSTSKVNLTTSKVKQFADTAIQNAVNLQNRIDFLEQQNKDLYEQLNIERNHSREQMDKLTTLMEKQTELTEQVIELTRANQILLGREQIRTNPALVVDESSQPSQSEQVEKIPRKNFFQKIFNKVVT